MGIINETDKVPVNATLDKITHTAMVRWCDENERSMSWFMRKAVDCYLDHLGIK